MNSRTSELKQKTRRQDGWYTWAHMPSTSQLVFGQGAWLLRNESRVRYVLTWHVVVCLCGMLCFAGAPTPLPTRLVFNALLTKPILTRLHFVAPIVGSCLQRSISHPTYLHFFLFNHLVLLFSFYTHQICYLSL